MKKRLMSTLLMGAFFLASTSMFVSCKDYDDDINANTKAIQNVESSLKEQIATLNSALQQEKTAAAAAHSQYVDAIAKAQAAADAANKSLADALVVAATHATTSYVDDAVKNGTADKATVAQLNDAIANLQSTLTAAMDGKAGKGDLNNAISAVNDKIAALNGDIAAATNAQNTLSATLTSAIAAVDQKVDTKASQEAVNALTTVLTNVQQSMQTKADVQEAIAAATANLATNASVAEKIQAAADAAKADVNLASSELKSYADKAATAAATEAAATAKAEAIAEAIKSAQNLEEKLTTAMNQMAKDGAAADAQLQKNLNDSVAVLVAKIGGINTKLSTLIDINKNAISKNLAAIENINLQIDALNRFTGLLEDKNVVSLKDSLRLTYAELQAAKKTLGDELVRIETKVDENALAYAAALMTLNDELTERIDSLRDNYATEKELEAATTLLGGFIEITNQRIDNLINGDVKTLQDKVKKIEDNIGEASIAAMLKDISDINKTIEVSALGKVKDLDKILEGLGNDIEELDGKLAEYKEANDKRVKAIEDAGYISETVIDGKISDAAQKLDTKIDDAVSAVNTELGKYILKAEIDKFLTGTKVVAALQTAGFALSSDLDAYVQTTALNTKLEDYLLKSGLTTEAIEKLDFIVKDDVQAIADDARDAAIEAAQANLQEVINDYDTQLATALNALFSQIANEDINGDDATEGAIKLPDAAKKAIEALQAKFEDNKGVSPAVAYKIDLLWIGLDGKLTSLVFYPESYYGGIESIEITALKIDKVYGLNDEDKSGTAWETFKEIGQKSREFDIFPNGYAKYHINPVNANLEDYTLAFIDHTATTRSAAKPYLVPVETAAAKNKRDANDILWVEFKNDAETYKYINEASGVPSMAHNNNAEAGYSHFTYGDGTPGKGIVTALTATKDATSEEVDDSYYVASDYALIVPVTINSLVLANTKVKGPNTYFELSDLKTDAYSYDSKGYSCNAANPYHLHRKVLERIGDDDGLNHLMYNEQFDLNTLVETHFVNDALAGADDVVDADLFRRLDLAYRFTEIDYDTEAKYEDGDEAWEESHHYTSESRFMTLTGKDTLKVGDKTYIFNNGIGYFNQVKANAATNGEKIKGESEFGEYKTANSACVGRQPVVRVELYDKKHPERVYAIGYLKLEISDSVEKDVETFSLTANDHLIATCDGKYCGDGEYDVVVRWDQIQEQLNELRDGQGLKPAIWNSYDVAPGQYVFDTTKNEIVLIEEGSYDKDAYPYYKFGNIYKDKDKDGIATSGVWTDVLAWEICPEDYQSLYFDAKMRDFIDENGIITKPIKRYVKLVSDDSADPDLFVGIEIPANYIHFPAGVIGKVKGNLWYEAQTNKSNGRKDMVLNVALNHKPGDKHTAVDNEDGQVENGWFAKNILLNFSGEKINVDLENAIKQLPTEALQNKAKALWKSSEGYYAGSKFYFREPNLSEEKAAVVKNGKWTVKGISGNTYTLMVTDRELMCEETETKTGTTGTPSTTTTGYYYWGFGESVSIVEINGVPVKETDPQAEEIDIEEMNDKTVWGYKFLTINEKNDDVLLMKIAKDGIDKDEEGLDLGSVVAGYSQDMLNYARHSWDAEDHVADGNSRPYNMQLTAYMMLVPETYGKMMKIPTHMGGDDDDPTLPEDPDLKNKCFVMPGYLQGTDPECTYCYDEVSVKCLEDYEDPCFAPIINNDNLFTVRFLQPVYIENNLTATSFSDAELGDQEKMKIPVKNFLGLFDWDDYFPSTNGNAPKALKNFIKYYGVKLSMPEEMTDEYWVDKLASDKAAARVDVEEPVEGFQAAIEAAAEELGEEVPTKADDVLALYELAKKRVNTVGDDKWPNPTKVTYFGDEVYDLSNDPYKKSITDATLLPKYEAWVEQYPNAEQFEEELAMQPVGTFAEWCTAQQTAADADPDDDIEFNVPKSTKLNGDPGAGYSMANDPSLATVTKSPNNEDYVKDDALTAKPSSADYSTDAAYQTALATWTDLKKANDMYHTDLANYNAIFGVKRYKASDGDKKDQYYLYGKAQNGKEASGTLQTDGVTSQNCGVETSSLFYQYRQACEEYDAIQEKIAAGFYDEYIAARNNWDALSDGTKELIINHVEWVAAFGEDGEGIDIDASEDLVEMVEDLIDGDGNWLPVVSDDETIDDEGDLIDDYFADMATAVEDIDEDDYKAVLAYDMIRTDQENPVTLPATMTKAALVNALKNSKTINEVSPTDLRFTFDYATALPEVLGVNTEGLSDSLPFTYDNNNDITGTFHIFIPFDVTYNYLDRAPAKPVRVWAIITINDTKGKNSTTTTGARRK